ncbi:MAG: glycosyltransferase [Oscillospiraceae bacterium]|nr:glycosyltransferase [Oscillospiraceae bacterium]
MHCSVAVSVIMPIYNVSRFLPQSLGGLLLQTLRNIEIICVNDGSTDDSLEIVKSYAAQDSRIRIIDKPNGGYGSAMNCGLSAATGEYIGILEPDDFAEPEMFERLYEAAVSYKADIVKTNYWAFRTEDSSNTFVESLGEKQYGVVTSAKKDPRIVIGPACIWSAIYRRTLLVDNKIRFTETPGASYQDTAFAFKVLVCADRVLFLKEAFLHYRTDNENSSVNSKGKIFSICDEFQSVQDFLNEDSERRTLFSPALQVHKLRVYGWNLRRLAPEYKDLFREQVALDFIKADYDGFLDKNEFTDQEWRQLQDHMNFYYCSPEKKKLNAVQNSISYRAGRILTWLPRTIRDTLWKRK